MNNRSLNSVQTDCTLDDCRTCEGIPPVCRECANGYTVNPVDNSLCGEL